MKMSIAWHERCLNNQKESLKDLYRKVINAQDDYDRLRKMILVLEDQIRIAKQKGKDGFDNERFLIKRKPK
jgi:septal ring factor EnvC (AmiA/AmiB activator)